MTRHKIAIQFLKCDSRYSFHAKLVEHAWLFLNSQYSNISPEHAIHINHPGVQMRLTLYTTVSADAKDNQSHHSCIANILYNISNE